jgi:dipeptidyl-peptidase-3
MMARYSILQCFLDAGKEFASLDYTDDDLSDLTVRIDRSKIITHGRPAVEKYLQKIQIYKATANLEEGAKLYAETTNVNDFYVNKVRPVVLAKKVPRKVFVQANTLIEGDKVVLKEYEPSPAGMIQSYAERSYI